MYKVSDGYCFSYYSSRTNHPHCMKQRRLIFFQTHGLVRELRRAHRHCCQVDCMGLHVALPHAVVRPASLGPRTVFQDHECRGIRMCEVPGVWSRLRSSPASQLIHSPGQSHHKRAFVLGWEDSVAISLICRPFSLILFLREQRKKRCKHQIPIIREIDMGLSD